MRRFVLLLLLLIITGCGTLKTTVPHPTEEFRGVWIATVANIDWPERPSDSWQKKQQDFLEILNYYKKLRFNAILVQVRTAGDAFYPSKLSPWSRYLTGKEGDMGDLNSDPLAWMITETHKRGLEFHAWLNPYRATFDLQTDLLDPNHDYLQHPEWMIPYGEKYYYNPGLPEVQQHLVEVVAEVVARYDIDGIHFDDYFYPYRIQGEVFDDSATYTEYGKPDQSLEDWRRSNISSLIRETHETIKALKPWVQFGISPFGVWRNASADPIGSDTRAGQTNYDHLFADPLEWSRQGWVDYLAPQLYWSLDYSPASHRKLLSWWSATVPQTPLYIGNGAYKIRNNTDEAWDNKKELPEQLIMGRKTKNIQGNIFFSAGSLMNTNRDVARFIRKNIYAYPAIPPAIPNLEKNPPRRPKISMRESRDYLYFTLLDESLRFQYAEITGLRKKERTRKNITSNRAKRIYLGELSTFRFPVKSLQGKKHLEIIFIDRYRQKTKPLKLQRN